jgi:hypothetical protein
MGNRGTARGTKLAPRLVMGPQLVVWMSRLFQRFPLK